MQEEGDTISSSDSSEENTSLAPPQVEIINGDANEAIEESTSTSEYSTEEGGEDSVHDWWEPDLGPEPTFKVRYLRPTCI